MDTLPVVREEVKKDMRKKVPRPRSLNLRSWEDYKRVTGTPESQEAIKIMKAAVREYVRGYLLRQAAEDPEWAKETAGAQDKYANIAMYFFKHLIEVEEFHKENIDPKKAEDVCQVLCGWLGKDTGVVRFTTNIILTDPTGWVMIESLAYNILRVVISYRDATATER